MSRHGRLRCTIDAALFYATGFLVSTVVHHIISYGFDFSNFGLNSLLIYQDFGLAIAFSLLIFLHAAVLRAKRKPQDYSRND